MERALCISLLAQARRMPGVAARLQPATQSKLLTRHFLLQHACAYALVSTCWDEIYLRGEFCVRFLSLADALRHCAEFYRPFSNRVWPAWRALLPPLAKWLGGFSGILNGVPTLIVVQRRRKSLPAGL